MFECQDREDRSEENDSPEAPDSKLGSAGTRAQTSARRLALLRRPNRSVLRSGALLRRPHLPPGTAVSLSGWDPT